MAQKPVPHSTSTTVFVPGDVLHANINAFSDTSEVRKYLHGFGNHVGDFTAVDMKTGYKISAHIQSHMSIEAQLEQFVSKCLHRIV